MALRQFLCYFFFFLHCVNLQEVTNTSDYNDQHDVCYSCAKGGPFVSCYCDNMCTFYKDCCFDAPIEANESTAKQNVQLSCTYKGKYIYTVQKCSSSWNGIMDMKSKCEDTNDFVDDPNDLFITIPVGDIKTNVTYYNRYCAECNNVDQSSLSFFSLELSCNELLSEVNKTYGNITEDFMSQNMIYHEYSWGVYHWDHRKDAMSFIPCSLNYKIPKGLSFQVRECQPFWKSTCAPDWNDDITQQHCISSNTNMVYDNFGNLYRNAYCAACNYITANNTKCEPPPTFTISSARPPGPSFVLLLDINSNNNETPCSPSQIYDSLSKKCRRLICTNPDEVPWYGKCVNNRK